MRWITTLLCSWAVDLEERGVEELLHLGRHSGTLARPIRHTSWSKHGTKVCHESLAKVQRARRVDMKHERCAREGSCRVRHLSFDGRVHPGACQDGDRILQLGFWIGNQIEVIPLFQGRMRLEPFVQGAGSLEVLVDEWVEDPSVVGVGVRGWRSVGGSSTSQVPSSLAPIPI